MSPEFRPSICVDLALYVLYFFDSIIIVRIIIIMNRWGIGEPTSRYNIRSLCIQILVGRLVAFEERD